MSHGLLLQGGYVYGNAYVNRYSLKVGRKRSIQTGDPGSITHALKFNWVCELPFGNGRHFMNSANGLLDRLVGGWGDRRHRAHPERPHGRFRQRQDRRDVPEGSREGVQDLDAPSRG
jgi:hypothetical protein